MGAVLHVAPFRRDSVVAAVLAVVAVCLGVLSTGLLLTPRPPG